MTDKVLRTCPECGERKLKRLIGSGGAVIFKGSGFYQTDYRSASYKKAAEADKKKKDETTSGKKDGKKEAKSESKPKTDKKE